MHVGGHFSQVRVGIAKFDLIPLGILGIGRENSWGIRTRFAVLKRRPVDSRRLVADSITGWRSRVNRLHAKGMGEVVAPSRTSTWLALVAAIATAGGCAHFDKPVFIYPDAANERRKIILPEYEIESPDLLQIDLIRAVPKPDAKIQTLDAIEVTISNALESEPLTGRYSVEPDGTIALGGNFARYKSVRVVGLSPDDAKEAIQKHLDGIFSAPKELNALLAVVGGAGVISHASLGGTMATKVAIVEGRAVQLVRGQHLVRPDGQVTLGSYGSVVVAGRTASEAKALIEKQLAIHLQSPEVVVNVIGYNSKLYYLIFDFGGSGQQVVRLPVTGNDTVLDAISQVNGLPAVSDLRNIRVSRSAGAGEPDQVLLVDWVSVTTRGRSETNYQLMPGDRIFVKAYPMTTIDTRIARVLSPIERLLGFSLLGSATYKGVKFANTQGSGGF